MRNLEPTVCSSIALFPSSATDGERKLQANLHATSIGCIDPATGSSFVVNQNGHLICSRPCGNGQHAVCASLKLQQNGDGGSAGLYDFAQLLNLAWLEEESALFAVFRTGELVGFSIPTDFHTSDGVTSVHTICEGITSAAWSPDYEQLALTTQAGTNDEAKLVLIARGLTFNVLSESTLDTAHPGDKHFITVGWGKKETQFHGKAGKDARKEGTSTVNAAADGVLVDTTAVPLISWREDCSYFAVSSVSQLENYFGQRVIRIYDRDGLLQYTSEHVASTIGSALAWRPSGNLIAASYAPAAGAAQPIITVDEAANSVNGPTASWQIIFFEKNGLRHGEFSLGEPYVPSRCSVTALLWNADSSVLAVVVDFPATKVGENSECRSFILLWTMMNYHWYLKQTLPLKAGSRLTHIMFDPINALQLHVITDGTILSILNFRRTVCCSAAADELLSHVAVVDGNRVLVTCFGEQLGGAVIPPPMCSYSVAFPSNSVAGQEFPVSVNECCFRTLHADKTTRPYLMVDTSDHKRYIFIIPVFGMENAVDMPSDEQQQIPSNTAIQISREQGPPQLPLVRYVRSLDFAKPISGKLVPDEDDADSSGLLGKDKKWDDAGDRFLSSLDSMVKHWLVLPLLPDGQTTKSLVGSEVVSVDSGYSLILHLCSAVQVDAKTEDHGIRISDPNYAITTIFRRLPLSPRTDLSGEDIVELTGRNVDSFKVLNRISAGGGFIIISHNSTNNRLYADADQIADDCTSYCVHPNFLIYTTHRDELKCAQHATLDRFASARRSRRFQSDAADVELLRSATFSRACEKGAFIVACSATQVVLQMPRGNLEVIYPRALVVQRIFCLLSNKRTPCYAEAYQLARRHRVNSNVLYDFDPEKFSKNIDEFVGQMLSAVPLSSQQNDYLELFITDFDAQDSTQSEYKELFNVLGDSERLNLVEAAGKDFQGLLKLLQRHLHARLDDLSTSDDERRLLFKPILATYAKLCQFEEALMCCKQWRSTYTAAVFSLDEALKFLMYWVHDMNQMFDYALSTYDFEIALLVGQKSTRDPREFVPLLRQFRPLSPPSYQQYSIDRHLRNYRKALGNLVDCIFELTTLPPGNDEIVAERNVAAAAVVNSTLTLQEALEILVQLVNEQKLFVPAITLLLCRKSLVDKKSMISKTLNVIRCNYADYLYNSFQKFDEAACQYYHAGAYDRACQLYQTCANWQMALVCKSAAASAGDDGGGDATSEAGSLAGLAKKAVRQLILARRFDEARNVAVVWLSDYKLAFQTSVDGHLWSAARELLYHPRMLSEQKELELVLESAVNQQAAVMREDVGQWLQKFNEYFDRLMLVRKRRAARALIGGNAVNFAGDDQAAGDDAASTITSSTASSRMSSVSRHKSREDRKKRSLKQGGRYEHVALMEALRTEVYAPALAVTDAVINVLDALALCDADVAETDTPVETGKALQNAFNGLVQLLASRASAIWRPEEQLCEVYQLSACVQLQQQSTSGGDFMLVNAVLSAPGRIDKASSEALYVDGMSADDVMLFVSPKIDLTRWNNHMLIGFKKQ